LLVIDVWYSANPRLRKSDVKTTERNFPKMIVSVHHPPANRDSMFIRSRFSAPRVFLSKVKIHAVLLILLQEQIVICHQHRLLVQPQGK